jgi:hypothetical protein
MLSLLTIPYRHIRDWIQGAERHEMTRELVGAGLARQIRNIAEVARLADVEFRVHSQFGDDGIIQWLLGRLPQIPRRFIEFGVEDYREATTRFLLVNDHWSGLVIDGSESNITNLKRRRGFWRHDLTAISAFLDRDNVDSILADWAGNKPTGILHIDVDGNDYWLWDAIDSIDPWIAIIEYNAVFGADRAITTPYDPRFRRLEAHHSGQYFGASLAALNHLANKRGFALIGTNGAGNNAYFVKRSLVTAGMREMTVAESYTPACFRNSLDRNGHLDYRSPEDCLRSLQGLPVVNVVTGATERL